MVPDRFAPVLAELGPLARRFTDAGHRLYLVGGIVRDLLVGTAAPGSDIDLTTDATPEQIRGCVSGWADAVWNQGEAFGTVGIRKGRTADGQVYEITTFRAEVYHDDSRKPAVTFSTSIEEDLGRRDFTINAMALEVTGDGTAPTLVDPYGGTTDLVAKVLRTPLAPEISFDDDPLRMLRAARFTARFEVTPTPDLVAAVESRRQRLAIVSAERVRDELDKLMVVDHPGPGLWFCVDTGLAEEFLPELPGLRLEHDPIHRHKDVLSHTVAVVDNVRPPAGDESYDFRVTRLAALFHDVGKPRTRGFQPGKGTTFHHHDAVGARMTRKRMKALRYPTADIAAVGELVALHLRFHTYKMGWSDSAVRRYVRDAGPLLAELNVLTRCDCTTRDPRKAAKLSRRMDDLEIRIDELAAAEELAALRPEIDGNDVMELLGVAPGRIIGQALEFLLEIRIEEGIIGREAAEVRLREWYAAPDR
ncbi:CCA tRNA nucleotidyltransferase [soil metagenome]